MKKEGAKKKYPYSFREGIVRKIKEGIFENPTGFSLNQFSKEIGIPLTTLRRWFREEVGVNFSQFVTSRLEEERHQNLKSLKRLIKETLKSVGIGPSNNKIEKILELLTKQGLVGKFYYHKEEEIKRFIVFQRRIF